MAYSNLEKERRQQREHCQLHKNDLDFKKKSKENYLRYRKRHLEELREKDKLRKRLDREKNPEKTKEITERFKTKHPDYFAKKMADARKKDPERYREQSREYAKMHSKENYQKLLQRWGENPQLKQRHLESLAKTIEKNRTKYNKTKLEKYHIVRDKISEKQKIRRFLLKLEVMSHYSKGIPKCKRCKETMIEFLTIDHIIPRKEHGHSHSFGSDNLLHWIIRNDYPKRFQILCWTCNMIKYFQDNEKNLSQKPENVKEREYRKKIKFEVLSHYSKGKPKCCCCGYHESILGLSIDHIKPIRKTKESGRLTSFRMYQSLKRDNYPKDVQVLCISCNSAKSVYDLCPQKNGNDSD